MRWGVVIMTPRLKSFLRDESGATTVEMAVIFLPLMIMVLTVFEIGIAYHFTLTAQKAAELGVRYAVTRDPIHVNMPRTNVIHYQYGTFGDACYQGGGIGTDSCLDPGGPWICDGAALAGDCDSVEFASMMTEIRRLYPSVNDDDVAIGYYYHRLGYAGGDMIPEVRLTIKSRPSPLQVLSFLDLFATKEGYTAEGEENWDALTLRAVTASAFGEDMSSAN